MLVTAVNPPKLHRLAGVGALSHLASRPKAAARRKKKVTRELADFSVFETSDGTTWGVCGLKLGPDILTFHSREEANASGNALARAARVSLWYEPTSHLRDGVLVASFRDDKVR